MVLMDLGKKNYDKVSRKGSWEVLQMYEREERMLDANTSFHMGVALYYK